MKITDITPLPVDRVFRLEVTEQELRYIRNAIGNLNSLEDAACGLDSGDADRLYGQICEALNRCE